MAAGNEQQVVLIAPHIEQGMDRDKWFMASISFLKRFELRVTVMTDSLLGSTGTGPPRGGSDGKVGACFLEYVVGCRQFFHPQPGFFSTVSHFIV